MRTVHRQVSAAQEYARREVESGTASNALDEEADMINIMTWMREAGISEDQAQTQADRVGLKSILSGTAPMLTPSGSQASKVPAHQRGKVPARWWSQMDEEVKAKIMQLPIKEQRRSFLKVLTQGHNVAIDRNTGHRRLHHIGGCYRVPHVDC